MRSFNDRINSVVMNTDGHLRPSCIANGQTEIAAAESCLRNLWFQSAVLLGTLIWKII